MAKMISQGGVTVELSHDEITFLRHVIGNNSINSVEQIRKNYHLTETLYTGERWAKLHDELYQFFNQLMNGGASQ